MPRDSGRPAYVYGYNSVSIQKLQHEVQITDIWFAVTHGRQHTAGRLGRVAHDTEADIDLTLHTESGDENYFLEFDTGTVSPTTAVHRWERRYVNVDPDQSELLIVTSTEQRQKTLMNHAKAIAHVALFVTLEKLLAGPAAPVWHNCSGEDHHI